MQTQEANMELLPERRYAESRTDYRFPITGTGLENDYFDDIFVTYKTRDEWAGQSHFLEEETVDIGYSPRGERKHNLGFRVTNRDYINVTKVFHQQPRLSDSIRDILARRLPSDVLRVAGIQPVQNKQ